MMTMMIDKIVVATRSRQDKRRSVPATLARSSEQQKLRPQLVDIYSTVWPSRGGCSWQKLTPIPSPPPPMARLSTLCTHTVEGKPQLRLFPTGEQSKNRPQARTNFLSGGISSETEYCPPLILKKTYPRRNHNRTQVCWARKLLSFSNELK